MGTVWLATDEVLHRQVAIKEIDFPPGTPPAERAQLEHRTLREARAIAALSNPYVITLFDILNLEQGPVIVMELLRARSLAEILKKAGRLPDGQAATIGVAVASGLLAAHAAGITHRDVKPGNVLICDDGRIKLTDFGIARSSADPAMTATGLLLGSPAYIAPEVASGVPAGPVSDAWSLGGLLFATVEGRPPFDQGTAIATLTSVVKDRVPPHPHSGRLGAVVSGLLVKTPSLRMRIDRALTIMRGIADDPSGTNLTAAARIPRNDAAAPSVPPASQRSATGATGFAGQGRHHAEDRHGSEVRPGSVGESSTPPQPAEGPAVASQQSSAVNPPGNHHPPTQGASFPPASSPADSSTNPPGARFPDGSGPDIRPTSENSAQLGRPGYPVAGSPGNPSQGPPPPWTNPQSTGYQTLPPTGQHGGWSPQPPLGQQGRQGVGQPQRGAGSEQFPRPFVQMAEPSQVVLPPPPWAQEGSSALAPLPASASPPNNRNRIIAAVLVAIVAAVLGFFGVRLIAEVATDGAQAVPTAAVETPAVESTPQQAT